MNRPSILAFAVASGLLSAGAEVVRAPRFPHAAAQEVLQGDPQHKSRPCLCQFGVDLKTDFLGYHVGQLLPAEDYGHHSYGSPGPGEHDGQLYTCGAGFIDSTHLRAGVDWTAHLVVVLDKLTPTGGVVDFGEDGGGVRLIVRRSAHRLTREDILRLAQRIAYERLTWHEVISWYYHAPARLFSEQQSTFSPEDEPSNFLGTEIGRTAIERVEASDVAFENAVDAVMKERLASLGAVGTADDTRENFAQVDRHQDGPVTGVSWYDSDVVFWDQRYLFKRNIHTLTTVTAWRVPAGSEVGCKRPAHAYSARVPRYTARGTPFTEQYEWQFTPERRYFRVDGGPDATPESDPRYVHDPLPILVTNRTLPAAVKQVEGEMRRSLGAHFDEP